jgi:hypothetical protein
MTLHILHLQQLNQNYQEMCTLKNLTNYFLKLQYFSVCNFTPVLKPFFGKIGNSPNIINGKCAGCAMFTILAISETSEVKHCKNVKNLTFEKKEVLVDAQL